MIDHQNLQGNDGRIIPFLAMPPETVEGHPYPTVPKPQEMRREEESITSPPDSETRKYDMAQQKREALLRARHLMGDPPKLA
jgi:hypothetical protein